MRHRFGEILLLLAWRVASIRGRPRGKRRKRLVDHHVLRNVARLDAQSASS